MFMSTSFPKTAGRRRSHPPAAIAAIVALTALTAWGFATYVFDSGTRSERSTAPTEASVLAALTPAGREYVLGIVSMRPAEVAAAFNTSQPSASGRNSGSRAPATRSGAPSLAAVLRSLSPRERRYVLGIASLTPVQLWAAFGTSRTPPIARGHGGSTA